MRRHRTTTAAGGLLIVTAALTGCGSGSAALPQNGSGAGATSATSAASGAASGAAGSAGSTSTAASTPAASPAAKPAAGGAKPAGACSMLSEADAARILGSPVTKTDPATDLGGEEPPKLDGCVYTTAAGTIGYDVLDVSKVPLPALEAMVKSRASGGAMKPFDPGLSANDTGYVATMMGKPIAFVHAVVGTRLVSLSASGPSAAAVKKSAVEAATVIVG